MATQGSYLTVNGTGSIDLAPIYDDGFEGQAIGLQVLAGTHIALGGIGGLLDDAGYTHPTGKQPSQIAAWRVVDCPAGCRYNFSAGAVDPATQGDILVRGSIVRGVGDVQLPFDSAGTGAFATDMRPVAPHSRIAVSAFNATSIKSVSSKRSFVPNFDTTNAWSFTIPALNTTDSTGDNQEAVMTNGGGSEEYVNVRMALYDQTNGALYPCLTDNGDRTHRVKMGLPTTLPFVGPEVTAGQTGLKIVCDAWIDIVGTDRIPYNFTPIPNSVAATESEGVETHATNITDRTSQSTASGWNPTSSGYGFTPIVQAVPALPVRSVAVLGDSRSQVQAGDDSALNRSQDNGTWVARLATLKQGECSIINLAASGARLSMWVANSFRRIQFRVRKMLELGVTDCIVFIGANDLADGRTSAQMLADLGTLDQYLAGLGIRMWPCTEPPRDVTSTDNFVANFTQSNAGRNTHRINYNAGIRSAYAGRFIEFADAVESARDSGVYKAALNRGSISLAVAMAASANLDTDSYSPSLLLGQYREDIVVFTSGAADTQRRQISNSAQLSATRSRLVLASTIASAAIGDTATVYGPYCSSDGLHQRTERAQFSLAAAAESAGVV